MDLFDPPNPTARQLASIRALINGQTHALAVSCTYPSRKPVDLCHLRLRCATRSSRLVLSPVRFALTFLVARGRYNNRFPTCCKKKKKKKTCHTENSTRFVPNKTWGAFPKEVKPSPSQAVVHDDVVHARRLREPDGLRAPLRPSHRVCKGQRVQVAFARTVVRPHHVHHVLRLWNPQPRSQRPKGAERANEGAFKRPDRPGMVRHGSGGHHKW